MLCPGGSLCQNDSMDRDRVLAILRAHEGELKAAGVEHVRLFGSVARGESTEQSDVDLAVTMDDARRWTLFTLGALYEDLREMLDAKIDVALLEGLHPPVAENVRREGIDAF